MLLGINRFSATYISLISFLKGGLPTRPESLYGRVWSGSYVFGTDENGEDEWMRTDPLAMTCASSDDR